MNPRYACLRARLLVSRKLGSVSNVAIRTLPLSFFPPKPASRIAEAIQIATALSEVRSAVNAWMYSS